MVDHPRDSRGLVRASLAAPEEIRSAVLEAADMAVPTTAPMVRSTPTTSEIMSLVMPFCSPITTPSSFR